MNDLLGIPLEKLEDPIRTAMEAYKILAQSLHFDPVNTSKLVLTPDKPNSARSVTEVWDLEHTDKIGELFVIAFKPEDGTGSEVNYKLDNLSVASPYPRKKGIIPRNKTGIHSEVHLTVLTHAIDDAHAEPILYGGNLDLLGLAGQTIAKIGELGHSEVQNAYSPLATLTVGYRGKERSGDPHAVYNSGHLIQVCAFLAVSNQIDIVYPNILSGLKPKLPAKL